MPSEKSSKIKVFLEDVETGYATLMLDIFYTGQQKTLKFKKIDGQAECKARVTLLRKHEKKPWQMPPSLSVKMLTGLLRKQTQMREAIEWEKARQKAVKDKIVRQYVEDRMLDSRNRQEKKVWKANSKSRKSLVSGLMGRMSLKMLE